MTFAAITGVASKFIAVVAFNYMVTLGEMSKGIEAEKYRTGFAELYHPMLNVPFFGTEYNKILPAFILVFGLIFAFMQLFKIDNKAMTTLKKIGGDKQEKNSLEDGEEDDFDIQEEYDVDLEERRRTSRRKRDSVKLTQKDFIILESLLKGE